MKLQVKDTILFAFWQAKRSLAFGRFSINQEQLVRWHEQLVLMDIKQGFSMLCYKTTNMM